MSYNSITFNKKAHENIVDAIDCYNDAIDEIKQNNDNTETDAIISLIKKEVSHLNLLKKRISDVNASISSAMPSKSSKLE